MALARGRGEPRSAPGMSLSQEAARITRLLLSLAQASALGVVQSGRGREFQLSVNTGTFSNF